MNWILEWLITRLKRDKSEHTGSGLVQSDEMSYEELNEGFGLLYLESQFEEIYGDQPDVKFRYLGWRRFRRWVSDFRVFRKGAEVGAKNMWENVKKSGWLKDDVQRRIDEEKDENGGVVKLDR